jgi:hypothetical protein
MPPIEDAPAQEQDVLSLLIANPDNDNDAGSADADAGNDEDTTAEGDEPADDVSNPEGTDDDGEGDEPGEGDEGDPQGRTSTDPLYTVTVDGKAKQITLKEALEGYQRLDDYTRKTQDVATARKAADDELALYRTAREQYSNVLKTLQERLGSEADEPSQADWDKLRAEDPDKFSLEWASYQQRKEQRATVKAEQDRVAAEQHDDNVKQLKAFVADQQVKLLEKIPAWKDQKTYDAGMDKNRKYAVETLGFTEKEVNAAYDHRFVVAINKARQFDELMAKAAAAKKKLAGAPDIQAPGARVPASRRNTQRDAAMKKLNETGKAEDAAALIMG